MFVLCFLFAFVINAQSQSPNDLVCENTVLSSQQWTKKFPTSYAFNGFWKADGAIAFSNSSQFLFAIPLDNSLWHQYNDAAGHVVGDLFLSGAAFGFPGALILSSRQVSNPMFSGYAICQNFIAPSPTNLIASYSELVAHGVGYMESKYFSLEAATFNHVFSNEAFNFDLAGLTAWSQTYTYVLGNGTANNYIATAVNFRYSPLTEAQAIALGWSGDVASVPAQKGFHAGRGAIPIGILNAQQRTILDL
jgi:hypothetical protein